MRVRIITTLFIAVCVSALMPGPYPGLAQQPSSPPSRHLYRVFNRDNKPGFIDQTGRLVIGFDRLPVEADIRNFHEGLAAICFLIQGQHLCRAIGFIDQNGDMAIAPRFKQASDFSEGLAYVGTDEMRGFIDRNGRVVIRLEANQQLLAGGFYEGRAIILTPQAQQGFIDRTGKVVVEPRYSEVRSFSEGLAAVGSGDRWRDMKYGFIDRDGKMVIPPRFEARVVGGPYAGGYIDMSRFSEGLARVRIGGLYGYINKQGELVIPPKFALAGDFSEGLASAVENDKVGFIDKRGKWVIRPQFAESQNSIDKPFGNGLAPVAVLTAHDLKWGYVDRTGRLAIPATFAGAFPFNNGVGKVHVVISPGKGLFLGYIDTKGRFLWEPQ